MKKKESFICILLLEVCAVFWYPRGVIITDHISVKMCRRLNMRIFQISLWSAHPVRSFIVTDIFYSIWLFYGLRQINLGLVCICLKTHNASLGPAYKKVGSSVISQITLSFSVRARERILNLLCQKQVSIAAFLLLKLYI